MNITFEQFTTSTINEDKKEFCLNLLDQKNFPAGSEKYIRAQRLLEEENYNQIVFDYYEPATGDFNFYDQFIEVNKNTITIENNSDDGDAVEQTLDVALQADSEKINRLKKIWGFKSGLKLNLLNRGSFVFFNAENEENYLLTLETLFDYVNNKTLTQIFQRALDNNSGSLKISLRNLFSVIDSEGGENTFRFLEGYEGYAEFKRAKAEIFAGKNIVDNAVKCLSLVHKVYYTPLATLLRREDGNNVVDPDELLIQLKQAPNLIDNITDLNWSTKIKPLKEQLKLDEKCTKKSLKAAVNQSPAPADAVIAEGDPLRDFQNAEHLTDNSGLFFKLLDEPAVLDRFLFIKNGNEQSVVFTKLKTFIERHVLAGSVLFNVADKFAKDYENYDKTQYPDFINDAFALLRLIPNAQVQNDKQSLAFQKPNWTEVSRKTNDVPKYDDFSRELILLHKLDVPHKDALSIVYPKDYKKFDSNRFKLWFKSIGEKPEADGNELKIKDKTQEYAVYNMLNTALQWKSTKKASGVVVSVKEFFGVINDDGVIRDDNVIKSMVVAAGQLLRISQQNPPLTPIQKLAMIEKDVLTPLEEVIKKAHKQKWHHVYKPYLSDPLMQDIQALRRQLSTGAARVFKLDAADQAENLPVGQQIIKKLNDNIKLSQQKEKSGSFFRNFFVSRKKEMASLEAIAAIRTAGDNQALIGNALDALEEKSKNLSKDNLFFGFSFWWGAKENDSISHSTSATGKVITESRALLTASTASVIVNDESQLVEIQEDANLRDNVVNSLKNEEANNDASELFEYQATYIRRDKSEYEDMLDVWLGYAIEKATENNGSPTINTATLKTAIEDVVQKRQRYFSNETIEQSRIWVRNKLMGKNNPAVKLVLLKDELVAILDEKYFNKINGHSYVRNLFGLNAVDDFQTLRAGILSADSEPALNTAIETAEIAINQKRQSNKDHYENLDKPSLTFSALVSVRAHYDLAAGAGVAADADVAIAATTDLKLTPLNEKEKGAKGLFEQEDRTKYELPTTATLASRRTGLSR